MSADAPKPTEMATPSPTQGSGGSASMPVLTVPFVEPEQAVKFYVFGVKLPSGRQNPTFEIETADQSSAVFASTAGTVISIEPTDQGDQTIMIIAGNDNYALFYDHVSNPQVSIGQTVTAGDQLGTVGVLNDGRGRSELMIKDLSNKEKSAQCITLFGSKEFNEAFVAAANRLNGSEELCTTDSVQP
ncbi:MAG: M23 family metallopeptidase [Candidatus Limnocylindrus sp.]